MNKVKNFSGRYSRFLVATIGCNLVAIWLQFGCNLVATVSFFWLQPMVFLAVTFAFIGYTLVFFNITIPNKFYLKCKLFSGRYN